MEETQELKPTGCTSKPGRKPHHHHGFYNTCPDLLPLLPLPPPPTPPLLHHPRLKAFCYNSQKSMWKQKVFHEEEGRVAAAQPAPTVLNHKKSAIEVTPRMSRLPISNGDIKAFPSTNSSQTLVAARRPDNGGQDGHVISLLANHFIVKFDPSQRIYHYDVKITPCPSKEIARLIKRKLVQDNPPILSDSLPVFDGRRNMYSPMEFQDDRLEFYVNLPIPFTKSSTSLDVEALKSHKLKLFRINIKLVSKLSGKTLNKYLGNNLQGEDEGVPLPQDYLQALDVVLRESPTESCIAMGRSLYSSTMGGVRDIGGGAIGLRGFFQSLRPTQQGLALNVDFSVMAFHESISVIAYLQKQFDFLRDLSHRKTRTLVAEEKREVEKALKNVRVFVCHRDTDQRYRVYSLTDEITENLKFSDRDGREFRVMNYYKEVYNHDIQYRGLPCLQMSRSKACYLPMELCMVCEGQKFLGKLSDDQTARILKMGCQKPGERREIINGLMNGDIGPTCDHYASGFKLEVSREMTQLYGRVLQPPKLKLGDGGYVRDVTPTRQDRQWNLQDSHVAEGTQIKRWALISFGGSQEQRFCIPKFVSQLSNRCEKLGIHLNRTMVVSPLFEQIHVLSSVSLLEGKLRKIHEAAAGNLQLLMCVMEKKHRGYADLKRIAETGIGVVSQCCLYSNISKLGSQFLVNLALKINAKAGGCNVLLYNTMPSHIPRLFTEDEPVIFMGADVTHPHPLDDISPSVAAVVGSMNWPAANKYVSRMRSQTHRQEIIEDLEGMVEELLEDFFQGVGKLPSRILFFRDGVSETQFHKVLKQELLAIRAACWKLPGYAPKITFIVVQKRHHTRFFPNEKDPRLSDENIPPGTVVDNVVTHPREFDFYLCSHWGMKGTSRPTHYHVLWDENHFKSDELQKLVHNLCYTFARCTKPVSLVPPAYYAHLAAYRGRLYLERSDNVALSRRTLSRSCPPTHTAPLPKLRENLKKLMFYC